MSEDKTPGRSDENGAEDKSQKSGGQTHGGRTVPIWTSLFKEPSWDKVFAIELNEMVGVNLLRSMELEDSEMGDSEEEMNEEEKTVMVEETFGLPEEWCNEV